MKLVTWVVGFFDVSWNSLMWCGNLHSLKLTANAPEFLDGWFRWSGFLLGRWGPFSGVGWLLVSGSVCGAGTWLVATAIRFAGPTKVPKASFFKAPATAIKDDPAYQRPENTPRSIADFFLISNQRLCVLFGIFFVVLCTDGDKIETKNMYTWSIIPASKWLISMPNKSPK